MPLMVIIWLTTFAQSMPIGALGRPSIATRPPWVRFSSISGRAVGCPLISSPMSKPSVMPNALWAEATRSIETFTARSTPIRLASSRRASLTSVMTMNLAPMWRATFAAIRPIGPAPVIKTSSPTRGKERVVCTALPSGSNIAARSGSMASGCCHTLLAGITTNSANAPSRFTPTLEVFMQRCRRPARQLRQCPQTMWPSPDTSSPTRMVVTSSPISTTRPENSCPGMSGAFTAPAAQASHDSMCRSVPQIPVRSTRILTSPGPGVGSGLSTRRKPAAAASL